MINCKCGWPLQIREIFNLFDTDKGGSIDVGELDFAMNALGFQVKHANGSGSKHSKKAEEAMNAIFADGYDVPRGFRRAKLGLRVNSMYLFPWSSGSCS
jgi:hypothetical protein